MGFVRIRYHSIHCPLKISYPCGTLLAFLITPISSSISSIVARRFAIVSTSKVIQRSAIFSRVRPFEFFGNGRIGRIWVSEWNSECSYLDPKMIPYQS